MSAVPRTASASSPADRAAADQSWWTLLRGDARCVLERDPAARSRIEVWTIYPGVHAVAAHRLAHALWRRGWRYLPRFLSFAARMFTHIDIHPGATIGARFFIDHGAGVVIGETAEIGNDVTLYHGVTLGGTSGYPGKRHPTLGDHVVVGAGATILGPIIVGHRARIAANSVVIDPVPENATVVGIPGRVVVPRARRATHGVDLNHHLIPDPVGKALACLLDRVARLEQSTYGGPTPPIADASDDPCCADGCMDAVRAPSTFCRPE
ncbi:serine O-acetyltransferase [Trinickia caryophylli]|uniref:serine O-acetyltransferase n=1 Tax=Trinickia caryophylli TaxID=28094 RepID=A0A1X7EFH9_TRICW|nr:serine O-acetyltransferase [Trinickia caryophylli]PMS11103.1 serine O-acetyltransferase [Trinickia caryophylli]TRX14558.1 serine O-acetyltransferase [Trinickia caryophylli]WQE14397.1 serine O-acetyltransferase [Trinickia caryophylli]SMF33078.1 serine O-acetyltransferase [Trinickia caryophylli]GLU32205.1 serine acetyltransferase [Trinickia caryophylli]